VLLFWIIFNLFVLAMLALDLGLSKPGLRRLGAPRLDPGSQGVSFRRALAWSAIWIALAAAFAVIVFFWHGRTLALQFVTGYVIELSLSIDNLFVFLLIFRYFKVAGEHQHKVLLGGIVGALVMRGLFIWLGVSLIGRFQWITYAFGALLIYSGCRLLWQGEKKIDPDKNFILRGVRRILPVTDDYVGGQFFTRRNGLYATPLLVALLVIETTDVLLAIDSVPAVLSITVNPFIVYTSNVFAILGLRSMYFALAGMIDLFHYLHYGLSAVLIFIGVKMLAAHYVTIPTEWALGVVVVVLGASILMSLLHPQTKPSV
jgi:tellurite resistance protein TerC